MTDEGPAPLTYLCSTHGVGKVLLLSKHEQRSELIRGQTNTVPVATVDHGGQVEGLELVEDGGLASSPMAGSERPVMGLMDG